jgi:ABC-type transport system substrate-binding protein
LNKYLLGILLVGILLAGCSVPVQQGGTLKIGTIRPPVNFGLPANIQTSDNVYANPIFEHLVRLTDKGYEPELAVSWKDGIFKLRQGVLFHDKTVFNASHVPFATRIDDYTVKVDNIDLWQLAVNSKYYIANGEYNGTGAFKLKAYTRSMNVTYEKNTDYWDKPYPYIDGVYITCITDPLTLLMALKTGEIDVMYDARFNYAEQLAKDYSILTAIGGNFTLLLSDNLAWARDIIDYAIDKEAICKGVGLGLFKSLDNKYNPDKARQLLDGRSLSFKCYKGETLWADGFVVAQANLADVGIKMEIAPLNQAAFNQKLNSKLEDNTAITNILLVNQAIDKSLIQLWAQPRLVISDKKLKDVGFYTAGDVNNHNIGKYTQWMQR